MSGTQNHVSENKDFKKHPCTQKGFENPSVKATMEEFIHFPTAFIEEKVLPQFMENDKMFASHILQQAEPTARRGETEIIKSNKSSLDTVIYTEATIQLMNQ